MATLRGFRSSSQRAFASAAVVGRAPRQGARLAARRAGPPLPAAAGEGPDSYPRLTDEDLALGRLMELLPKFGGFDLAGKRMYIREMESLRESFLACNRDIQTSEDPLSREMAHSLNVQLLEANTSVAAMADGLQEFLDLLRQWADQEELIQDPVERRRFQQQMEEQLIPEPHTQHLFSELSPELLSDPVVHQGFRHPLALKAYHKCVSDPSRVKDYIDQPELYNFLCRILSR